MWYLICYDVADDRRRLKLAGLLDDFGDRLQESVFQIPMEPEEMQRFWPRIAECIDPDTDSLACLPVCRACRKKAVVQGRGELFQEDPVWIV